MFFPVSGLSLHPFIPLGFGFAISLICSVGGISGAFLLLPFQMSVLGFTTPAVSATNQLYNIIAIPSGVVRYYKEGRLIPSLARAVAVGTLPGVGIGAWVRIRYLPDPKAFQFFAGIILFYIGYKMLRDLARKKEARPPFPQNHSVTILTPAWFQVRFRFQDKEYGASPFGIIFLSFIVGIVGGIYGIGGGAIIAPFLVSFFGLPVYTIAGAALLGTFITSVAGVGIYQGMAFFYPETAIAPDWQLGLLFGLGGFCGMYCGARLQKFIPETLIQAGLLLIILFTAGSYVLAFFN